jgi:hypothetical protein
VDINNPAFGSVDGVLFNKSQTTLIQCPGGKGGSYTVPDSGTSIGDAAFFDCTSLTGVTIGTNVTSIGDGAFSYCLGLTSVAIPNSVINIGEDAFSYCANLTSATIGSGLTSIGNWAFSVCTSLTNVTIPNSITSIGDGAFSDCASLTNVTIPNRVTSIGYAAFFDCFSLASITIPNSVTNIADQAFFNCTNLTGVYFQGSTPGIGSEVFEGDNNATAYYLPGATGWDTPTFGGLPTAPWPFPDFLYLDNNGTITITGYTGSGGDVTIPDTINGLPVTGLGDNAFFFCTSLAGVTIGTNVTSIGYGAFYACTNLTNVTIPGSVTSIGDYAFAYCALTNVMIPSSVISIGDGAFEAYGSLMAITVDTNNPAYCSVDGVLFNQNQTALIQCPCGITGSYTIPNSVASIGDYAFSFCALTNVMIPYSVTNIGDYAFSFCALTSITIPNSVTSIGFAAFYDCTGLNGVTIPNSVTNIGDGMFDSCSNLTSVTIGNGVTSIGYYAFNNCTSLTSVYFQGNAPSLGLHVFDGDNNATVYYLPGTTGWDAPTFGGLPTAPWPFPDFLYLDNNGTITITGYTGPGGDVTIPDMINGLPVTGIGDFAFEENSRLTSILIPDSVTNIGWGAFYFCSGLTNVTIGNGVTSIGMQAFNLCTSLTSITISNSVTNIGENAFQDCSGLTNATIGGGVTSIGDWAFAGCTSLNAIMVNPANLFYSSINGVLFNKSQTTLVQYPGGLGGSYTIPNSVISIGNWAFYSCANLTAIIVDPNNPAYASAGGVLFNKSQTALIRYPGGMAGNYTIPNTVTSIADFAFQGCSGLTGVTIPDSVTVIGEGAFYDCTRLTSVTIPNGVTSIEEGTFEGCYGLTNATIGSGVTSIGYFAFCGDDYLTVYFLGDAPGVDYPFTGWPTFYYLPGTTGWGAPPTLLGLPMLPWLPQVQNNGPVFGVQTNGFGFNINWASGQTVVVEACTDLANPVWSPVGTNTLTGGSSYFSDPQWTNYPGRYYRLRSP